MDKVLYNEKRPKKETHKRDPYVWKETYIMKRDLCNEKRPICMKKHP